MQDATGSIPVTLPPNKRTEGRAAAEEDPDTDIPVIVIGSVCETEPSSEEEEALVHRPVRFIEAKKLIPFSLDSNISEQWLLEVTELSQHVYPQMAAAANAESLQK